MSDLIPKKKLKLNDLAFYGQASSSKGHKSEKIEWDRSGGTDSPIFFTDGCLELATLPQHKESFKVAWLLEPYVINPYIYKYVMENSDLFDMVLTHHQAVVQKNPKAVYYPNGMSWVKPEDWIKTAKTKNVCILASGKNTAPGHQMRHQFIKMARGVIDVYGYGYKPVGDKAEILKDYMFSVEIENSLVDAYFTEKLLDCFATYTIPIYWGCPSVSEFFNPAGIIHCRNIQDMTMKIEQVLSQGKELYHNPSVQKALEENFQLAKVYRVAEDWIHDNILVPRKLV